MADIETEKRLPRDDLEGMVRVVEPGWTLEDATFVENGVTSIYRVRVATDDGPRESYLKATPSPEHPLGIGTEARLTEVVRQRTDAPVPKVIGAVDDHDRFRAPYFLVEAMPGTVTMRRDRPRLPADNLRSLARQTGRYLGQVHGIPIPNVDAFGKGLSHRTDAPLRGGTPDGDPDAFVFPDGYDRWTARLRDWIDEDLDDLAATDRFDDLVDPVAARLEDLVEALPDAFAPALGRIDHGLWNVLTDPDCRRITAVLDWGSLFVVPPAYDLAVVEYFLAGGLWIGLADVHDARPAVREALLDGYREVRPVPDGYDLQRRCYQLDAIVVSLVSLDDDEWSARNVPEQRADEAAAGLRAIVESLLAGEDLSSSDGTSPT